MHPRPLSPHATVYRYLYTITGSFAHRVSGVALSAGLVVLTCWLVAAASGAEAFADVSALLSGAVVKVLLALWLAAFCYHLFNGVRHLAWDFGYGFEKRDARRSFRVTVAAALILFAVLGWLLFVRGGAAP